MRRLHTMIFCATLFALSAQTANSESALPVQREFKICGTTRAGSDRTVSKEPLYAMLSDGAYFRRMMGLKELKSEETYMLVMHKDGGYRMFSLPEDFRWPKGESITMEDMQGSRWSFRRGWSDCHAI